MQAVQGTHEAVARDAAAGARPSDILAKWSSQASDRHLRHSRGASQAFEVHLATYASTRSLTPCSWHVDTGFSSASLYPSHLFSSLSLMRLLE